MIYRSRQGWYYFLRSFSFVPVLGRAEFERFFDFIIQIFRSLILLSFFILSFLSLLNFLSLLFLLELGVRRGVRSVLLDVVNTLD